MTLTEPMARALEMLEREGAMTAARLDGQFPDPLVKMSEQLHRLGLLEWAGWRYFGRTRYLFCKPSLAGRKALEE